MTPFSNTEQGEEGRTVVAGTLYVVATPIGNLGDLTYRARAILAQVNRVLAEDTRQTATLFAHYGIKARAEALHEHNEAARAEQIAARLLAGESAALVSDAGTPGISDPGARLVAHLRALAVPIVPVPGPSAVATAMSVAGIDGPFLFLGFLPVKSGPRRARLQEFGAVQAALVIYEAPHRVIETVADLVAEFGGERQLLVARELTKRFESITAMPLRDAGAWFAADPNRLRGEFVLIVHAPTPVVPEDGADLDRVLKVLLATLSVKQAVSIAVELTGAKRNHLYARALELRGDVQP